MLELLSTRFGIPREHLAIAGYADTVPVDTNETEQGRTHNRRVDIVILNRLGVVGEPESAPHPAPAAKAREH
jgi:chemotaxis protein MotB